jgi:hypothetical protein
MSTFGGNKIHVPLEELDPCENIISPPHSFFQLTNLNMRYGEHEMVCTTSFQLIAGVITYIEGATFSMINRVHKVVPLKA